MTDKRLYPNTVIFQTTDGKGVTYYNARVLEQIRAEIERDKEYSENEIVKEDVDYGIITGLQMALDIIEKYTKGDTDV